MPPKAVSILLSGVGVKLALADPTASPTAHFGFPFRIFLTVSTAACFGLQLLRQPLHTGFLEYFSPLQLRLHPYRRLSIALRVLLLGGFVSLSWAPLYPWQLVLSVAGLAVLACVLHGVEKVTRRPDRFSRHGTAKWTLPPAVAAPSSAASAQRSRSNSRAEGDSKSPSPPTARGSKKRVNFNDAAGGGIAGASPLVASTASSPSIGANDSRDGSPSHRRRSSIQSRYFTRISTFSGLVTQVDRASEDSRRSPSRKQRRADGEAGGSGRMLLSPSLGLGLASRSVVSGVRRARAAQLRLSSRLSGRASSPAPQGPPLDEASVQDAEQAPAPLERAKTG